MTYYEVALLNSPLAPLTYQSDQIIEVGVQVEVKLANRKKLLFGVIVKIVDKPSFRCTNISEISDIYYDSQMLQTAVFISSYYICSLGEALTLYIAFQKDDNDKLSDYTTECNIELSPKQEELYEFTQQNKQSLLFASTGSGKTEIYIKAIQKALKNNSQAIMLMPEISLTPQMQIRLEKVFGTSIAIWHSKVTKKKKQTILDGLASGEIRLIAGARSALFLPYKHLGLIIVDEEHDESYKANNKPRINVKDLSLYIGQKFDIQVILGSATPSITSYKKVPYIRNKETFFETTKSIQFDESNLGITQNILDKIANTISQDKQVIVFLPTRANFKYQICSDCGTSIECPFCSVSLSMHKYLKVLKCHYCNYTQAILDSCPSCHTGLIKNYRLGTAEVKLILDDYFQDKVVEVFDRDTVKTDKQLRDKLKHFNDEKIDILVGTQMLSKGHDYHNVTLAVILGIDSVLNMTSYKSRERALSLALQIAGRSGRKGMGEVVIQTKNKDFFSQYLEQNNYEEFLEEELSCRTNLYPPFVKIAKVIFSHQNSLLAQEQLNKYIEIFGNLNNEVELIGFGESDIFKIANKYRYELLLRSSNVKNLLNTLHSINSPMASIDMDTL
ncbi:MAG: primosomal protein N' [Epsilonproteobacteria bacterium]|nr:MAG: primosomal protein N' [Campylobacterota bacterium]